MFLRFSSSFACFSHTNVNYWGAPSPSTPPASDGLGIYVMYRLSVSKDCTAGSFSIHFLSQSCMLIHTVKRENYVLTHYRKVNNLRNVVVQDDVQERW